jgi:hypothetical protein
VQSSEWTYYDIDHDQSGDIFFSWKDWALKIKFRPWNEGQAQIAWLTFITWVTAI